MEPEKIQSKKVNTEMITAIAAIFIGLSAMIVSIYQTSLIRQQQRGSVWPHIEGGYRYNFDGFRLMFTNTGIGPAKIEAVEITVDGKAVADWASFLMALGIEQENYTVSFIGKRVIASGSTVEALIIPPGDAADQLYQSFNRVGLKVCYASVYNDRWLISLGNEVKEVNRCNIDEQHRFRQ